MSRFLVITGLSGAGRSQAADDLEDLGWFVVDNLPTSLVGKIGELASAPGNPLGRIALVVGSGRHQSDILAAVDELRADGHEVSILFLDASTDELVRRYGATRRRHPFDDSGAATLADVIESERATLDAVKSEADVVVDTSQLNVHQLKARMAELFGTDADRALTIAVRSFGYKHGVPVDADLVLDCRFLPNPHWEPSLRPFSGLDAPVRDYVLGQPLTGAFLERLESLLDLLLPGFAAEGKSYVTIALGCTGGRHRSVALAEEIAGWLRSRSYDPSISHRDVDR